MLALQLLMVWLTKPFFSSLSVPVALTRNFAENIFRHRPSPDSARGDVEKPFQNLLACHRWELSAKALSEAPRQNLELFEGVSLSFQD